MNQKGKIIIKNLTHKGGNVPFLIREVQLLKSLKKTEVKNLYDLGYIDMDEDNAKEKILSDLIDYGSCRVYMKNRKNHKYIVQ